MRCRRCNEWTRDPRPMNMMYGIPAYCAECIQKDWDTWDKAKQNPLHVRVCID